MYLSDEVVVGVLLVARLTQYVNYLNLLELGVFIAGWAKGVQSTKDAPRVVQGFAASGFWEKVLMKIDQTKL